MGKKEQDYTKLYIIEKLIRIVEENGEKLVVVKWKNFSDFTKEPLEYFKTMPLFREEIQKLEQQFENKKFPVNLNAKMKEWNAEFDKKQKKIIQQQKKKKLSQSQPLDVSLQTKTRLLQLQKQRKLKKIKAGLKDMTPKDYFYFRKLLHICQLKLESLIKQDQIPNTDRVISTVKGVLRIKNGFLYCVKVDTKVYTCSLKDMQIHFPYNLTRFLTAFTAYMKNFMEEQIKEFERLLKNRGYKQKAIKKIQQALNAEQKLKQLERFEQVAFGVDQQDCLENKKDAYQKKQYLTNILKQYSRQKSKKQNIPQEIHPGRPIFKSMYEELSTKIEKRLKAKHPQLKISMKSLIQNNDNEDSESQSYNQPKQTPKSNLSQGKLRLEQKKAKLSRLQKLRSEEEKAEKSLSKGTSKKIKTK